MSGADPRSNAEPVLAITEPMERALRQMAGHKYGWAYVGGHRRLPSFLALERRGLARLVRPVGTDLSFVLTPAGRDESARRWPLAPAVHQTYEGTTVAC